jgi:hypothetical protein
MLISLTTLLSTLSSIWRSRAALGLENLALRHQIGVLRVCQKTPEIDLGGPVTTENFVGISTGSFGDDDRDCVGASRSFRQITRGSKVSVFLTRQVDVYAREK